MAEQLIATTNVKDGKHIAVPTLNSGVVIVQPNGKITTSHTLPDKVQENIDVEKISFGDSVINDATATKHGLLPKLTGDVNDYLDGTGEWSNPSSSGNGGFANIFWVQARRTVTIDEVRENVVTNMLIDGSLIVDGRLTTS